jgi:predicted nucleotidyltransferase
LPSPSGRYDSQPRGEGIITGSSPLRGEGWERVKCQYYFETVNNSTIFSARPMPFLYNDYMRRINEICKKYNIVLCYLFGSHQKPGKAILEGRYVEIVDTESDIDFAVVFMMPPENPLETYASLSLDLQELVSPFRADLLFLYEVDHLIQLEAINGINIYAINNDFQEAYEENVMMFASDELEIFKRNEKDLFEAIENGYFEFEYKADRR